MAAPTPKLPSFTTTQLTRALDKKFPDDTALFNGIVNAPFQYKVESTLLFLGIVVLLLVDEDKKQIDRVALSQTELAENTTHVSVLPFHDIKIPMTSPDNIIVQAVLRGEAQDTSDWKDLFTPALTPEEARMNQASGGIAYSAVYPLSARSGGALIFSYFQYYSEIGLPQKTFMEKYTRIVNDKLLTQ